MFNVKVFYRLLPGASSRDVFYYIKLTLQDPQTEFDIEVLHIGANDILSLESTVNTVSNSILHIANQCKPYGVREVSILSVTCTTLLNSDLINDVINALRNKFQSSGYHLSIITTLQGTSNLNRNLVVQVRETLHMLRLGSKK